MNKQNLKYEALGFVEALIAIMVVGISSVVLMQIAVNTIQNTIQNETIDEMTQYAVEASEIVQDIANEQKGTEDKVFPDKDLWGDCFSLQKVSQSEYTFTLENEETFKIYQENVRDTYKNDAILNEEDELFRIICLDSASSSSPTFVVTRIIVGQRNSDGIITKGNNVKDYTYFTVVKL